MKNKKLKKFFYILLIIIMFGINFYYSNFVGNESAKNKSIKPRENYITVSESAFKTKPKLNNNDKLEDIDITFKPYMYDLQKNIRNNWEPDNYNKSLKTIVAFKIDKNGNLLETKIKESSKVSNFDKKALKAVINSAPFGILPKKCLHDKIQVEFSFEYRVYPHLK